MAQAAQIAAGSHPTRLACRPRQTTPGTGRSIAKKARPGTITTASRRMRSWRRSASVAAGLNRIRWLWLVRAFAEVGPDDASPVVLRVARGSDPRLRRLRFLLRFLTAILPRLVCRMAERPETNGLCVPARQHVAQAWSNTAATRRCSIRPVPMYWYSRLALGPIPRRERTRLSG